MLVMRTAAVGVLFWYSRLVEELELYGVDDLSRASVSRLMIFINIILSISHHSSVSSQLMMSGISGGNLFIKIEVSSPPYNLAGTPNARRPLTCVSMASQRRQSPLRSYWEVTVSPASIIVGVGGSSRGRSVTLPVLVS